MRLKIDNSTVLSNNISERGGGGREEEGRERERERERENLDLTHTE